MKYLKFKPPQRLKSDLECLIWLISALTIPVITVLLISLAYHLFEDAPPWEMKIMQVIISLLGLYWSVKLILVISKRFKHPKP